MKKPLTFLITLVLLTGCESFAHRQAEATSGLGSVEGSRTEANNASFSADTLYSLLAAELAGQRNRFDVALGNYVNQAQKTRDPGVAERSYHIAEFLGAGQPALDSALIWVNSAPNDDNAMRAAAIQLARAGRHDEALRYMERILQHQGNAHFDFIALSASQASPEDRHALLESFEELRTRYPKHEQLLFAEALLLQQEGRPDEALKLLEQTPARRQKISPLLLRASLLNDTGEQRKALSLLKKGMQQHPDNKRLHLNYARQLLEMDRVDESRSEFVSLLQRYPDDDDLRFTLALVYLETEAWEEAAVYLQELIARGSHVDSAYFNLGHAYEKLGENEAALSEYAQVGPGPEYLPAQLRQARLLLVMGRTDAALQRIRDARNDQPEYAVQLYVLESELLGEIQRPEQRWTLLQTALENFPDSPELLYARAMLAESRNDLPQLERDLRQILRNDPENPAALNALGYTLADRTKRFGEARQLIERAYRQQPDNPAIIDSLGWLNYREGRLDEALKWLQQAYRLMPDGEIAAHLGEVLWVKGRRQEALEIWRDALQHKPDERVLLETIRRLTENESI